MCRPIRADVPEAPCGNTTGKYVNTITESVKLVPPGTGRLSGREWRCHTLGERESGEGGAGLRERLSKYKQHETEGKKETCFSPVCARYCLL